jgi:hypothetical protein
MLRRTMLKGVAACAVAGVLTRPTAAQEVLKMGISIPMTGAGFNAVGRQLAAAIKLYVEQHGDTVAGRKIEIILRDDAGVADNARRIIQEMIVNERVGLVGIGITPTSLAIAPLDLVRLFPPFRALLPRDQTAFMVYPVRRGELLNYVGFVPTKDETAESWSAVGDRDQLAASFEGWDRRVVGLLEKVDSCFWWGLYDRRPLASWTKGRLALLGDAAHAMLPHLGQGANQAIEDAVALAVFLEGRNSSDVVDILRHYEAFRRERTDVVQAEARKNGLRYDSRYNDLRQRDQEIAGSAKFFRMWLYDYDVENAAVDYLSKV